MKKLLLVLCLTFVVISISGCKKPVDDDPVVVRDNLEENVEIKVNFAAENSARTMTYNKSVPLTLIDGTIVTAGNLKPMWQFVENELNINFEDVTVQDQGADDMISTAAANQFEDAVVFGGNSIMEELMNYGSQGYLIDLNKAMTDGHMPNFKAYLDANPSIKSSITAYNGGIYAVPYIAEIGTYARAYHLRETWVTKLLDVENPTFDTDTLIPVEYDGYYVGANARTGSNGGSVTPKTNVTITKATTQNIITLQNAAVGTDGKLDGAEATNVLRQYIEDNYDYDDPSELFVGEKAAYDMDELIALFRCVKANPTLLTDGKADSVSPFFVRQTSYREDLLRFAMYFGGTPVFGSDSYGSRWAFDADGKLVYTYYQEDLYNALTIFSEMYAEGLIHQDFHVESDKTNYRKTLYGSDNATNPAFGFMTMDWIASTTADNLNQDVVTVLPPVAKINGVWQYYIENSRVLKPDGWAISKAASEKEQLRALTLFDYFFSEEGHILQNYGLPNVLSEDTIVGPDGITYPKYKDWILTNAQALAQGDLSTFLRDWLGCQMPIGYQKVIGFEYQYTSERGFDGWKLLNDSTCNFATYAGNGIDGENDNFYKLVPTFFSFTNKQQSTLEEETALDKAFFEMIFNVVRYKTADPDIQDVTLPVTYAEYKSLFDANGAAKYIEIYNAAYEAMTAN